MQTRLVSICCLASWLAFVSALPQTPNEMTTTITVTRTPTSALAKTTYHLPGAFPTTLTYVATGKTTITMGTGATGSPHPQTMVLEYTTSTIDPWPALPTDFPLTHIVTLIATNDVKPRALQPGGPFTTAERHTSTWHSTFILWKPVDAVEFLEGDPPCEGAEEVDKRWTPDHTCKEEGLRTGCTRQCDVFSGLYWCARYMAGSSLGETEGQQLTPEKGVGGRVCWGNGSEVVQLLQPCVAGDYKAGCVPGARRDKERSKPTRLCRN